ncbi:hypothetical protein HMPREF9004_1735 [Schaalia cardiffensis F0333]|uniref:Uncharacterized protein n=1 Tax=Schaalia cardiffensis F0333 TaxID=888050 RepID=N6W5Q5_9ACTO|nr:hypothetical protein HMPREF9004_1735 [Schaalia cardiffensis F0333]
MPWILEETPGQSMNRPTCVRLMSDLWAALSPAGALQGPQGWVVRLRRTHWLSA